MIQFCLLQYKFYMHIYIYIYIYIYILCISLLLWFTQTFFPSFVTAEGSSTTHRPQHRSYNLMVELRWSDDEATMVRRWSFDF